MATSKIVRKSFNGGEIAEELWFRSDLETYHNSCKSLLNMTVTPWGAATRRPPTEQLAKIDTATYGVPIRYIPFRFSLTEVFHIILTDGSGSASPQSSTADMIIYDGTGTLDTLSGASTKIANTPYDPDDLEGIHYVQVNDFIYQTCKGLYAVQTINRFYDDAQAANRWSLDEFALQFGPFDDQNIDAAHTMALDVPAYDAGTTYAAGDVVSGSVTTGTSVSITQVQWHPYFGGTYEDDPHFTYGGVWHAVLTCTAPHGLSVGDSVTLTGCDHDLTSDDGGTDPVTVNGARDVIYVYSDRVFAVSAYIRQGEWADSSDQVPSVFNTSNGDNREFHDATMPSILAPVYADVAGSLGSSGSDTIEATFISQQASNTGEDLSDPTWWKVGGANVGVQVASADVVSSKDVFTSDDVGRLLAVQDISDERKRGAWNTNQSSNPVNAYGSVTLTTEGGAWGGLLELQQSTDDLTTWETIGSIRSENGESNGSIQRTITGSTTAIRVRLTDWAAPTGDYETEKCVWELEFAEDVFQLFEITAYTDAQNVTVETISPLLTSLSSANWKLGEYSEGRGYPSTLSIHDDRMHFGGSTSKPSTVWASRINGWNDFLATALDTSPYTFTLASDSYDSIRWLRSARRLMIGTDNGESTMGTRDPSQAITPTNVDVQKQTNFGSSSVQAVVTADLVFFVQGQGRRVRSTQYDFGTDQYLSSEMSILSHHITESGIKEMSFRRHPFNSIFFVLNNGTAVSFTYERDNQVKGWSRVEVGGSGEIISASANYSETGDIVGGIVKRGADYYLEVFGSTEADTVFLDSQVQFVDEDYSAGVTVPWTTATGLTVVRDDVELTVTTDYTISGGTLTIPAHTDGTVTVGYKFDFEVEPTDIIELGDHGIKKRISELSLYLVRSGSCTVSVNDNAQAFQAGDSLAAEAYLNGEYQLSVDGGRGSAIQLKLSGNHHKPFNLSAFGVYGQPSR